MGVIILYDHVHPVGAFAVKAAIDVRREGGRQWGREGGGGGGERVHPVGAFDIKASIKSLM